MSAFIDTDEFRNTLYSWPQKVIRYLYEDYYDLLLKIADMHTHDRSLSEDAVQEVFTDISQRHRELGRKHDQPFHTYLIRAVTNHAITMYRKNLRSNMRDTRYFYTTQSTSPPEKNAEAKMIAAEKRSLLRIVVGTLPPREQECFLMQTEQNLKVKEIARRMGITPKTVEWHLTNARKKLRKYGPNLE
jgi:RNA polymerase sigma-70 factor, ECF subfamily